MRPWAYVARVAPRERFHFYIDEQQRAGLRAMKERDGISESEQIRRAIDAWLEQQGVTKRADRKRVSARPRP